MQQHGQRGALQHGRQLEEQNREKSLAIAETVKNLNHDDSERAAVEKAAAVKNPADAKAADAHEFECQHPASDSKKAEAKLAEDMLAEEAKPAGAKLSICLHYGRPSVIGRGGMPG